ncbi:DUF4270 domain-containing protein [Mucilaginibacter boryungensis]|uniref:DUF4270 domain-containing protein n=1 Tax=Mucilaginibacter boryungensis TaxID=768480 RepID=A0ABR9XL49_9SPHI|nr:DUF4270 domain-containing protein [Mucilaginibacter boryungensis]MBE9667996.1 DUF4270 domain-containing protein [Mucilaginibacter boryungensis]
MKFFRIDLLTLLISLFILSSCKNQDGIGLNPDQSLNGTLLVDDNIAVNTVPEDSVITNGLTKTPLGYFNDPQIGTTESNVAAVLSLPLSSAYTPPSNTITIDSAVLVLRYANGFYGDSLTSKYKVNVYQLNEKPLSTINYYNTRAWNYNNSVLLGTKTFNSRTHTPVKVTDIVSGAKDTLKTLPPQVRVPISASFINNNLFNASSTVLASNTLFQNAVKGLYFTMDKTQPGAGGTFMLQMDSSNVMVYYRTTDGTTTDTATVTLPFAQRAAQIKHTYNATVQGVLSNQAAPNSTFYIQGLAGLRTKISFPNLKDIVTAAGSDIVINRAELVITPTVGSTIPFTPQTRLNMYQLDLANQRTVIQDASAADKRYLGVDVFGGFYTAKNDYHFIITGYIQDLITGKTKDYGTYLGATDFADNISSITSTYYQATPQTAGRLVAAGKVTNTSLPDYPYRIKLNIIYTKTIK